ncbi:MAG: NADH-quinone oxidoreductase subunit A [Acidobacteria bacterium]|nr:NADH-quinone oxidoreductase subunit A [Acidobacteriota bacterium]
MTLGDYLPVLLLLGLAVLFGAGSVLIGRHVGPNNPTPAKLAPYESGIVPHRLVRGRFPVKFALVAMLFIIFDVEVVFLYPWAVIFRELGLFGLAEMGVFVGLLLVAYAYVWRMGGLEWERVPREAIRPSVSPELIEAARRGAVAEPMYADVILSPTAPDEAGGEGASA